MIELFVLLVIVVVYFVYFFYWFRAFQISAPFYPTSKKATKTMLQALKTHKAKHVLELGAGDGRVAVALAKEGYEVTAVEFNPILVWVIYIRKFLGGYKKLHVKRADFLKISYKGYDAAFIYLYPKVMDQLSDKISSEMPRDAILVTNTFKFHDREPVSVEDNKVFIYKNGN